MTRRDLPRLHVVTDDEVLRRQDFHGVAQALIAGLGPALAFHVRGPGSAGGRLLGLASTLGDAATDAGAWLMVNDRVDVALVAGARGVHLGQRSLAVGEARRLLGGDAVVGVSTHDAMEEDEAHGADYLFVGSVFATPSHPGTSGRGLLAVSAAAARRGPPVVAIGGVGVEQVAEVVGAGADGVAVMRGIWDAPHPLDAAMRYLDALRLNQGAP